MDRWAARRAIVRMAWPVVAEQFLQTLTGIADMIMVGHLGAPAVAAVGLSNQPLFVSLALFMGISTGTTAVVARGTGAGRPQEVTEATRQSFWLAVASALAAGLAYWALAPQIIGLMGAAPEVAPLGVAFLRWMAPGFVAMQWATVMGGAFRGEGDTRTPMRINVAVNIANVILGYGLIYGHFGLPALGVAGSGMATSLARMGGALAMFVVLLRSRTPVRLRLRELWHLEPAMVQRILRVGVPTAGERLVLSTGMILFTRAVAGLGTETYAAHQIVVQAESIAYMPAIGVATAATARVGQRLGARDPAGARQDAVESVQMCAAMLGAMGVGFFLFARPYTALFTTDPAVQATGAHMLRLAALNQVPMAVAFVLSGALRGAGDTVPMLWATAAGVWIVRLGLTALLTFGLGWGYVGAWVALGIDWLVRALVAWWRFQGGRWQEVRV